MDSMSQNLKRTHISEWVRSRPFYNNIVIKRLSVDKHPKHKPFWTMGSEFSLGRVSTLMMTILKGVVPAAMETPILPDQFQMAEPCESEVFALYLRIDLAPLYQRTTVSLFRKFVLKGFISFQHPD